MQQNSNILNRIKEGEGLHLDFKHSISDTKKIARSLAAFANTEGGSLLIGVRDNGSIAGMNSEEEYYMIETAALIHCKPSVKFTFQHHAAAGKQILEIIIPKSEDLPHSAPDNNGVYYPYVRVKDENIVAPKTLIEVWKRKKHGVAGVKIRFDDVVETLLKDINENGSITKSNLMRITGIRSANADRLLVNMMLMNILNIEITATETKYILNSDFDYSDL